MVMVINDNGGSPTPPIPPPETDNMKGALLLQAKIFVILLCSSQTAFAETYRCTFNREIVVGANGLVEDKKDPNKGEEYFVALEDQSRGGKISQCTPGGRCGNLANIHLVTRWSSRDGKSTMLRLIMGGEQQLGQLWSVESNAFDEDFTVVAVSALGQRSTTDLGTCRKVMQ